MPDSALNGAEQALQQSFRKFSFFSGLAMLAAVLAIGAWLRTFPDRIGRPETSVALSYQPVDLPPSQAPLRLVGAWVITAADPRFTGLSGLAIDAGRFLSVSDLGSVIRFDLPSERQPRAELQDLRIGPGKFGKKRSRDAESLARDPRGRGWWVGYEQHHSLWLYDPGFRHALASVDLKRTNWPDNRGAEGLLVQNGSLLVLAENGTDAVRIDGGQPNPLKLRSDAEVADAAKAPDGSAWVLTRAEGVGGIEQRIAPLLETHDGYLVGPGWPLPKGAFDNFEGMAIEARPDGSWRFWLVTDDGHRVMARTLLVALDVIMTARHDKGPERRTGPSR
jgi:hypothetical protein